MTQQTSSFSAFEKGSKLKVYLAGPMRGYDQFNFPAFYDAAAKMRGRGHEVVSPAERDESTGFDATKNSLEGFDLNAALRWDLCQIIDECDGVVTLPGWEASKGANAEVATCLAVGKVHMELAEFLAQ